MTISGSGNHDSPELKGRDVLINVSVSGEATVWATDTLSVDISGSDHVDYQGHPKVKRSVTGSGNVTQIAGR